MEHQNAFKGFPWNTEPTDDWNRVPYWHDYYRELLAEVDPWRREQAIHRQIDLLIRMLTDVGELPQSSHQTVLDAGCGIALIPQILADWGFQVTAIDSCLGAIEVASRQRPTEEELTRCVPIWEPCKDKPGVREIFFPGGNTFIRGLYSRR